MLARLEAALDAGKPALTVDADAGGAGVRAAAVSPHRQADDLRVQRNESDMATADDNPYVQQVRDYVKTHLACEAVVISAQIESDLIDLSPEEAAEFLKELVSTRAASAR